MSNVIYLYEITPQEEIFCQNYVINLDTIKSAYMSGMHKNVKDKVEFDKLSVRQRSTLSKAGTRALEKKEVKLRISEIAAIEAERNNCASVDEILNYLTICVRKSKANIKDADNGKCKINTDLIKAAINAISVLIKRYPDFAEEKKETITFKRGV